MGWGRRIAIGLGGVGWLAALFLAWVWWRSEGHLARFHPATRFAAAIPTDPASLARGEHIARTRGCIGCHGDNGEGQVFGDDPWYGYGRTVAPNLTLLAKREDPATLEAAIRQGIGHDGKALWSMPSFNFVNLSDADTAALIGFLKTLPVRGKEMPRSYHGWLNRWGMAIGRDAAIPAFIPQVPLLKHKADARANIRLGEYLAMTSCNECHGFGLRGDVPFAPPDQRPPDLAGARGYDRVQFHKLMRTGLPPGGRKLRLMDEVSKGRFVHWADAEVDAIYDYLLLLGQ